MNEAKNLMGRLAQLCNIVSRPELNDKYVLIQSFLPDRNHFSVMTIPSPVTNNDAFTPKETFTTIILMQPMCTL